MRVLGIDYGTKRIGVAFGDTESRIAVPLVLIESKNWEDLLYPLMEEEEITIVVIGQGGTGSMEPKVHKFVEILKRKVKVIVQDEHFTTKQIEQIMKNYGKERKKIDKDMAAAALILQSWFDSLGE